MTRVSGPSTHHELAANAYVVSTTSPQIDATLFVETVASTPFGNSENHFYQSFQTLQRIRQDYTDDRIIGFMDALALLLSGFHKLERLSEAKIVEFLGKSLMEEVKQLPNLQLHLEESGLLLEDETIQKIAESIDSKVGAGTHSTLVETPNNLQGFQSKPGFDCSDTSFKNTFYLILQVFNARKTANVSDYIHFMLQYYKKVMLVDWFETAGFPEIESKINKINDFLLSTVKLSTTLYIESAISVIEECNMLPELAAPDLQLAGPASPRLVSTSRVILKEDETELLANVDTLIHELNESDMNFEVDFRYTLRMYIHMINGNTFPVTEKDINYLNDLVLLINVLVDFENSTDQVELQQIYNTSMQLHRLHRYLSPASFSEISSNSTCLMRYCVYTSSKELQILRSITKQWNSKTLKVSQLSYLLQNSWSIVQKKLLAGSVLGLWFSCYQRQQRLRSAASQYYSKKLQAKLFFSGWKRKMRQHRVILQREDLYITSKFLSKWKRNYNSNISHRQQAITYHHSTIKHKFFQHWTVRTQENIRQQQVAERFFKGITKDQDKLTLSLYFQVWYDNIRLPLDTSPYHDNGDVTFLVLTDKLKALALREDVFLYKRYFRILEEKYKECQAIAELHKTRSNILVRYAFDRWRMLTKLATASKFSEQSRHLRVKRNIFYHWQHAKTMKQLAQDQRRKFLLRNSMCQWKLKKNLSSCDTRRYTNSSLQRIAKGKIFKLWHLEYNYNRLQKQRDSTLAMSTFSKWLHGTSEHQRKYQYALAFNSDVLCNRYLRDWQLQLQFQRTLPSIADTFNKNRYFNKFILKFKKCSHNLEVKLEEFRNKNPNRRYPLNDRILISSVFTKWKLLHEVKFQQNADLKLQHYEKSFGGPMLKRMVLNHWYKACVVQVNRRLDLELQANEFCANSRITRLLFLKWKQRHFNILSLKETGYAFEDRMLRKKYLVIWYDQHKNKNEYLMEICEEFIQQKDLKKIGELLREWSMKNMKYSSRNQQSCDLFIRRLDSSRKKAIFELWVYKFRQRRSPVRSQDDFFDISNDSIVTLSPLAVRKKAQNSSFDPNENYLHTPIKSLSSNIPNTPHVVQNISPTRQQTSQRMKEERIRRLTEHFGKARRPRPSASNKQPDGDISQSDIRSYSFLSNHRTRLSPPKRPDFGAAPDLNRSFSMESVTTKSITTQSDIETAKKLRRITPIFIPGEDDLEPRISPLLTIKRKNSQKTE